MTTGSADSVSDVRMRGFARRTPVAEALAWLDRQASRLPEERVPLAEAATRVLARDVLSPVDVPSFVRAMMDGFAVRGADTLGASPYSRLELDVVGESKPGHPFAGTVGPGQAVRIATGAPLPPGADAVLPVEVVQIVTVHGDCPDFRGRENGGDCPNLRDRENGTVPLAPPPARVLAQGEVSPGKHLGLVGEDIAAGTRVLSAGRVLRPQDVGVLASIGLPDVWVVRRPRVRIVVTGNELLPAGSRPEGCRIVDSNGPMLAALVARDGGLPELSGIVPDEPEAVLAAMRPPAGPLPDVLVVSGGSSVGQEDHAAALVARHGQLPIHGLAMRPSSPTGMGLLDGRLVFLLPGNPVSCLAAYDFFAGRAIRVLGGRSAAWPYRRIKAPLARKIVSAIGRVDYLRVRLVEGRVEPLAVGGASQLSSTTRADGFVVIPQDSEGYPPDTEIEVHLYD